MEGPAGTLALVLKGVQKGCYPASGMVCSKPPAQAASPSIQECSKGLYEC